ncbi:MAG: hypothetical protein JRJ85_26715 [Deltaproteobacteria bacterium]|nr:hypothetical protein [Deltaproteobacteria bacterium]
MAGKKILVPFNFTEYDEKALHYVLRDYAGRTWARVTLFHAYTPLPEITGFSNTTLGRLGSAVASMSGQIREKETELKKTVQDLVESGFLEEQVNFIFKPRNKSIASEVVDMVIGGGYDTVVLTSRPGRIKSAFTRNVHDKLLATLKNKEICIIT